MRTYAAYTINLDFQRNLVHIHIFHSMDCKWHLLHKQHSHIDVYIDLRYRLEHLHMVVWQSTDQLHKIRQGMDFLIILMGIYTLVHLVKLCKRHLVHKDNLSILFCEYKRNVLTRRS